MMLHGGPQGLLKANQESIAADLTPQFVRPATRTLLEEMPLRGQNLGKTSLAQPPAAT